MSDEALRELERKAQAGDTDARAQLVRELLRLAGGDVEALHAAVVAAPDDLIQRHVLAEHYVQREDPRGELMRVQLALAETRYASRRAELRREEEKLLHSVASACWKGYAFDGPQASRWSQPAGRFVFRRGCVEAVRILSSSLWNDEHRLFRREPVDDLRLTQCGSYDVQGLIARPWLPRLRQLKLRGEFTDADVALLAQAPGLAQLERLNVGGWGRTERTAEILSQSSTLTGLTGLTLSGVPVGDAGTRALANAPHLAGLRTLHLSRCNVGQDGVAALAASSVLANLRSLSLDGSDHRLDLEPLWAGLPALEQVHTTLGVKVRGQP